MTQQEEEAISVCGCDLCPTRKLPEEEWTIQRFPNPNTGKQVEIIYSIVSPPSCLYKYVKIEGKFYKRIVETSENCDFFNELPPVCHDCGIKWGLVHHFGCDVERCPKCDQQIIWCDGCRGRKRFYKELPKTITPSKVDRKTLRKFIQQ